jgi:hypothetical protein
MKSEKIEQARQLLSEQSRELIGKLSADYTLEQPPENLALLSVLDPVTLPVVAKSEDAAAVLQVRTLKGGMRLVRLVRADPRSPWKIDLTEELQDLQTFLGARSALESMREQAGEYAASWKAFTDQLGRMNVTDSDTDKPTPTATSPENRKKKQVKTRTKKLNERKKESVKKRAR